MMMIVICAIMIILMMLMIKLEIIPGNINNSNGDSN